MDYKKYNKHMKEKVREWLGINRYEARIEALERLLLHEPSRLNGFAVLKKHLQRPDVPLPNFMGKEINQD